MTSRSGSNRTAVDLKNGLVSRSIFVDHEIYQRELERIFATCWLFLGHESQIPKPGDYLTNYMGEDPVIVVRDGGGNIRVLLNSCRHRGMKVCRADGGSAQSFTCSFHGWTYGIDGALIAVPQYKDAYYGELDLARHGLKEARVATYGGLIFGSWGETAETLDSYLGELRWYFDVILERLLGGMEVIAGQQRYTVAANWKIAAENFAGDNYHLPHSHGSIFRLDMRQLNPVNPMQYKSMERFYNVATSNGHGLCGVCVGDERYEADLALARTMGAEIVEYVEESHARLKQRLSARQAGIHALGFANMFPNFSFNDFSALRPIGLHLWHPRAPGKLESWQWCALDRDAPAIIKEHARIDFTRVQAVSGVAAQDDTENFEQVTEATRGVVSRRLDFNYTMGVGHEGEIALDGYPGQYGRYYSEHCQRNFYRAWAQRMGANGG